MPRCCTVKPVALATIACSNEIFEPSANDVTIDGFWPQFSAKPFCVVGFRYGSCSPLTLPITRGSSPRPFTQRKRSSCTPGSSPSHADRITPCRSAYTFEDRADRGLELGVHQYDVLAVRERLERDMRTELDGAGHLADHVDVLASAEQERIVGHGRAAGRSHILECVLGVDRDRFDAGVPERFGRPFRPTIGDPDHSHPRDAVDDLVRQALPHEAGADDPDADRAALRFALLECRVDDDHPETSIRLRNSGSIASRPGHCESFGDITDTGSGQLSPRRGSSAREPALGVGRVELAHVVARLRRVHQRLVSVREPLRHVEGAAVLLVEAHRDMLEVGRTLGSQVDDDVENRTARAADDLRLRRRRELEMHPPERPSESVVRNVCLRDDRLQPMRS